MTHTDKSAAFSKYAKHYLATNGQFYWSDTFQLATYIEDYHKDVDARLRKGAGSELISELLAAPNAGKILRRRKRFAERGAS
jgi:hypothetical protein